MSAVSLATLGVTCSGSRAISMATLGVFCQSLEAPSHDTNTGTYRSDILAKRRKQNEQLLMLLELFARVIS